MYAVVTAKDDVSRPADHVRAVPGDGPFLPADGWHPMGAVSCDGAIQRARHYQRGVRPRVEGLQETWPDADTASRFRARMTEGDLSAVLRTTHRRKLAAMAAVTDLLAANGVETRDELRVWVKEDAHRSGLLAVHGIGPETVDCLGSLVGAPTWRWPYTCARSGGRPVLR